MTARAAVLRRIREALGPDRATPPIPRDYRTTSDLDDAAVLDRFAERAGEYRATVHRSTEAALPALLADLLAGAGTVVVPAGLPRAWLDNGDAGVSVRRDEGQMTTDDLDRAAAVVTAGAVAIAETGTVVLDAGPDQGRRAITLVPDHHVCVVSADRIVATVPEGLARLDPTRPLTLISGPSATSDIELDRVEGVHGPRNLDLVILEG